MTTTHVLQDSNENTKGKLLLLVVVFVVSENFLILAPSTHRLYTVTSKCTDLSHLASTNKEGQITCPKDVSQLTSIL